MRGEKESDRERYRDSSTSVTDFARVIPPQSRARTPTKMRRDTLMISSTLLAAVYLYPSARVSYIRYGQSATSSVRRRRGRSRAAEPAERARAALEYSEVGRGIFVERGGGSRLHGTKKGYHRAMVTRL